MDGPALAGDITINIVSQDGFSLDDVIKIGDPESGPTLGEYCTIIGFGSINVNPPLANSYGDGTPIESLGQASVYYAGSDPITFYAGKKFKFWLPVGSEMLMLETPDIRVYGTVFQGPEEGQQWFDSFRITIPDGNEVAKIERKTDGNPSTATNCSHERFEQMNIFVGRSLAPLSSVKTAKYSAGPDVQFAVTCRIQDPPLLWNSRTEYVYFETPKMTFAVTASHAGTEFPNNQTKALENSHLDLVITEMKGHANLSGVLPEVWELRPRSDTVQAMMSPEGQNLKVDIAV